MPEPHSSRRTPSGPRCGVSRLVCAAAYVFGLVAMARWRATRSRHDDGWVRCLALISAGWFVVLMLESVAAPVFVAPPTHPLLFTVGGMLVAGSVWWPSASSARKSRIGPRSVRDASHLCGDPLISARVHPLQVRAVQGVSPLFMKVNSTRRRGCRAQSMPPYGPRTGPGWVGGVVDALDAHRVEAQRPDSSEPAVWGPGLASRHETKVSIVAGPTPVDPVHLSVAWPVGKIPQPSRTVQLVAARLWGPHYPQLSGVMQLVSLGVSRVARGRGPITSRHDLVAAAADGSRSSPAAIRAGRVPPTDGAAAGDRRVLETRARRATDPSRPPSCCAGRGNAARTPPGSRRHCPRVDSRAPCRSRGA